MTKNWKKIRAEKKINFFFFIKTAIYPSLGLHKVCPSYRRSLQLTKEAIHPTLQNMNFKKNFYFYGSFLPSWIRIRIRNPGWQHPGVWLGGGRAACHRLSTDVPRRFLTSALLQHFETPAQCNSLPHPIPDRTAELSTFWSSCFASRFVKVLHRVER